MLTGTPLLVFFAYHDKLMGSGVAIGGQSGQNPGGPEFQAKKNYLPLPCSHRSYSTPLDPLAVKRGRGGKGGNSMPYFTTKCNGIRIFAYRALSSQLSMPLQLAEYCMAVCFTELWNIAIFEHKH